MGVSTSPVWQEAPPAQVVGLLKVGLFMGCPCISHNGTLVMGAMLDHSLECVVCCLELQSLSSD